MKNRWIFVLCPLLLSAVAQAAGSLTYAATLGRTRTGAEIETYALTTNVEMTVAIYPSKDGTMPLWCRRLSTDVVNGRFAVVLADDIGIDVSLEELAHPATYGTLAKLFAATAPANETWVEVSNVCAGGQPLADVARTLPRGKIAAAPFALIAERAESSHSSFRVRGTATVAGFESIGAVHVAGNASFADTVTFNREVSFGDGGLSVTGLVSRSTLDGIGTLSSDTLSVSGELVADTVDVTDGNSTTLVTALKGFQAPESIRVAETFAVGGTLGAETLAADALEARGDFILPADGVLDWSFDGTLIVPDGVYAADDANKNLVAVYSMNSYSIQNETGKNAMLAFAAGAMPVSANKGSINSSRWALYGTEGSETIIGFDTTMLFPLSPGDIGSATAVITRYMKELSK